MCLLGGERPCTSPPLLPPLPPRPSRRPAPSWNCTAVYCPTLLPPHTPTQVELKAGMRVVFLGKLHYGCTATLLPDLGKGMTKTGAVAKGELAGKGKGGWGECQG